MVNQISDYWCFWVPTNLHWCEASVHEFDFCCHKFCEKVWSIGAFCYTSHVFISHYSSLNIHRMFICIYAIVIISDQKWLLLIGAPFFIGCPFISFNKMFSWCISNLLWYWFYWAILNMKLYLKILQGIMDYKIVCLWGQLLCPCCRMVTENIPEKK